MKKHDLEDIKGERKRIFSLGKKERRILIAYSICVLFLQLGGTAVLQQAIR